MSTLYEGTIRSPIFSCRSILALNIILFSLYPYWIRAFYSVPIMIQAKGCVYQQMDASLCLLRDSKPVLIVECEEWSYNLIRSIECGATFKVHFSWHECIHTALDVLFYYVARQYSQLRYRQ